MDKMIEENEKAMCILKNEGEKTLKDLAKMLGITTEGARFQLLKLSICQKINHSPHCQNIN